jgi:segregation and condensation protein B
VNDSEIFREDPLWDEGGDLPGALEALFTAAGEVLDMARLRELTSLGDGALQQGIEKLQERLTGPSGLRLLEVAGGWRMATSPVYREMVARLVTTTRSGKLTPAQIEALAIVAYRQPVTITELNAVRGITSSANQVKSLMERQLITPAGRKPVVGRPMTYATTQAFLLHFGLKSLQDLPHLADFGEGRLEAEALAALEPPLPEDGLFGLGALITEPEPSMLEPSEPPPPTDDSEPPAADEPVEP